MKTEIKIAFTEAFVRQLTADRWPALAPVDFMAPYVGADGKFDGVFVPIVLPESKAEIDAAITAGLTAAFREAAGGNETPPADLGLRLTDPASPYLVNQE